MGHRLSKIYTRTGDDGTTGLGDGSRVAKDHRRVEAFGTVDELNSLIGLVLSYELPSAIHDELTGVQHRLFDLGGELCVPGRTVIDARDVAQLESALDRLNESLEPLREFILPGGSAVAAVCHVARTVCRRAERRVVTLAREDQVNPNTVHYLNRLSDLLFVIARHLNARLKKPDVLWQPRERD
jgi:cob(I)alamin adenosyltransferase